MGEFLMPSLGADMEAGKLVEWLKQPGDFVKSGDIIAVVETQKGAIEIEVFETGMVESHLLPVGATVPVGTELAMIRTDGAAGAQPMSIKPEAVQPIRPVARVVPIAVPPATAPIAPEQKISLLKSWGGATINRTNYRRQTQSSRYNFPSRARSNSTIPAIFVPPHGAQNLA